MIVLVANEKGGTGKTLIAVNLAVLRSQSGNRVLICDTDPQSSAFSWAALREELGILPKIWAVREYGPNAGHQVFKLEKEFDDIIIDAGGRDSEEMRSAMVVADKIVIPFRPSQFDIWGLERMGQLMEKARKINPALTHLAVINLASAHPGVKEPEEALEFLSGLPFINAAKTAIRDRIAFRRAIREGVAVTELSPPDTKARAEMISLYEEVYGG